MLVLLKNNWFGPGGVHYPVNKLGTEVPDELCGQDAEGKWLHLPRATKKLAKAPKPAPVAEPSLKDLDEARAAGDALTAANKAGAEPTMTKEQKRLAKAASLRAQIEAEQADAE